MYTIITSIRYIFYFVISRNSLYLGLILLSLITIDSALGGTRTLDSHIKKIGQESNLNFPFPILKVLQTTFKLQKCGTLPTELPAHFKIYLFRLLVLTSLDAVSFDSAVSFNYGFVELSQPLVDGSILSIFILNIFIFLKTNFLKKQASTTPLPEALLGHLLQAAIAYSKLPFISIYTFSFTSLQPVKTTSAPIVILIQWSCWVTVPGPNYFNSKLQMNIYCLPGRSRTLIVWSVAMYSNPLNYRKLKSSQGLSQNHVQLAINGVKV